MVVCSCARATGLYPGARAGPVPKFSYLPFFVELGLPFLVYFVFNLYEIVFWDDWGEIEFLDFQSLVFRCKRRRAIYRFFISF